MRAQLLDARRRSDLLGTVRHLTLLQIDPAAAVAPSADLVAGSRLGTAHRPEHLSQALQEDRTLWEHKARRAGRTGVRPAGRRRAARGRAVTGRMRDDVRAEIEALATWLGQSVDDQR